MEFSFVLSGIPEGVVTISAAILAAIVLVILTISTLGFRLIYGIQGRLAGLESKVDLIWDSFRKGQIPNLPGVPAPGNPMTQERWDELARKLDDEQLSKEEAEEFHAALLERREQAIREKDTATLVILGAGIAFTEWQLKEMDARKK